NRCTVGVSRFSEPSHWERHPTGDELLHILEGEADVVTLTDGGPVRSTVRAGSIFICPRGLWHRVLPRSPLSMLFATPGEGTEHSDAKEPRRAGRGRAGAGRRRPLEGEVDVAVLTDDGPAHVTVGAGSVFVCPKGLWHRQLPRPAVTMFFGTPTENEEVSWAEDPRREG